jgi:hypothetical protein
MTNLFKSLAQFGFHEDTSAQEVFDFFTEEETDDEFTAQCFNLRWNRAAVSGPASLKQKCAIWWLYYDQRTTNELEVAIAERKAWGVGYGVTGGDWC